MKSSTKFLLWIVVFIVIMAAAMFGYQFLSEKNVPTDIPIQDNSNEESITAVDFSVYDYEGNEYKLSDFFGKPIVVNFWATWCGPCQFEMPAFQKAYEEFGDEVVFLMVNLTDGTQDTVESVKAFVNDSGYTFPVYCDTEYSAAYAYAVYSIPKTVFINTDGTILTIYSSAISENRLYSYIEAILEGEN